MHHDERKNIQETSSHIWSLDEKENSNRERGAATRCRENQVNGGKILVMHLKMLQSFYNYGSSGVINHWPRQFSDTGSANYMLWDRIALLQLHPINIFCREVRVSWNLRSASCYHINMKPPSLGMTPGSGAQYRLSAEQHLTVAEMLLHPKKSNGSIPITRKQVWHPEVPVMALLEDSRKMSYTCCCEVADNIEPASCQFPATSFSIHKDAWIQRISVNSLKPNAVLFLPSFPSFNYLFFFLKKKDMQKTGSM